MDMKPKENEINDPYWWLGPLGVILVVFLVLFAMIRGVNPERMDELGGPVKKKAKSLIAGKTQAIWLGMEVAPITRANAREFGVNPKQRGVVIVDLDNGQGSNAGMNVGDVVVAINGAKITDFDSFLWLAKQSKFSDGILLDVITNGRRRYVSMPFLFEGGPLMGPNTQHWQLGTPLNAPALGYGRLAAFTNNAPAAQAQSFLICPGCGLTSVNAPGSSVVCPNCRMQMLRNQ